VELNKIYCGDSLEVLKTFPDNSIDCVVTSPPYFSLRSYLPEDHPDKDKEVGTETSPEEYVNTLTILFREVRRVLSPSGTCWLNLGDSYASNGIYIGDYLKNKPDHTDLHTNHASAYPQKLKGFRGGEYNIKKKDLLMMPHRVAIALQMDGWYVRSDITYHKKNCMPSSVKDRPVSSKEYVFLLTKSPEYYYDWEAIATEPSDSYVKDKRPQGVIRQRVNKVSKYHDCDSKIAKQFIKNPWHKYCDGEITEEEYLEWHKKRFNIEDDTQRKQDEVGRSDYTGFNDRYKPVSKVRRRDVWSLTVPGNKLKHFAMMNVKLIDLCIKAGCPEGGVVLDPFMGAGSVGLVAKQLGRNYVGIELNPEYVKIAEDRINNDS